MYFEGNKLLEISAVPVPANGEALALRGIGANQLKSILSVEETEDSYIVTYAKYPVEGEPEAEEEAFGNDEEEEDAFGQDDDEEEEAFGEDDDDEEEEKGMDSDARLLLKSLIRDTILELFGTEPQTVATMVRSTSKPPTTKAADPMSVIFGLDK